MRISKITEKRLVERNNYFGTKEFFISQSESESVISDSSDEATSFFLRSSAYSENFLETGESPPKSEPDSESEVISESESDSSEELGFSRFLRVLSLDDGPSKRIIN